MGPEASVYVYNNGQENYAINFAQLIQKDGSFLLGREKIDNFDYSMLKLKKFTNAKKQLKHGQINLDLLKTTLIN